MKIKLITKHVHDHGHTRVLPEAGVKLISAEGHIEVDNEQVAEKLVGLDIGWDYVSQSETTTTTTVEVTTTTTTDTVNTTTVSSSEKEQLIKNLDTMKLNELQEIASVYPKTEWQSLNKEPLKEYLKKKIEETN